MAAPDGARGPEAKHDSKSPGRPQNLDPEHEGAIEMELDRPPAESGFVRDS